MGDGCGVGFDVVGLAEGLALGDVDHDAIPDHGVVVLSLRVRVDLDPQEFAPRRGQTALPTPTLATARAGLEAEVESLAVVVMNFQ